MTIAAPPRNGHAYTPRIHVEPGRFPPCNIEAEHGVLGSIMLDNDLLTCLRTGLKADDFFRDTHQVVYRAMIDMADAGTPIDAVTLADELERRGCYREIGGDDLLTALDEGTPHAVNGPHYAGIVRELSRRRALIAAGEALAQAGYAGLTTADAMLGDHLPGVAEIKDRGAGGTGRYEGLTDEDLGVVAANTLDPERVEWEWANRIARGKLNLLAGEGGDGKSQLAIAVAAAITTGGRMPDGAGPVQVGDVLILAAEDGMRDTIIPRLIAAGADTSRVRIVTARVKIPGKGGRPTTIHPTSFQDLDYWQTLLDRFPAVRLIIADPIPAFLGKDVNDHKNADVRRVLEPFVDLLSERRVAMVGITHLGKSTDLKTPVHKILGSVAYANLARSVHLTIRDPEDKERRFLCQPKVNIGKEQPTLAFRIDGHTFDHKGQEIATSRVVFEAGTVDTDAATLMGGSRETGKRGPDPEQALKVGQWVYDYLTSHGPSPVGAIIDAAGEAGHTGHKKSDGKWSNPMAIWRGKDKVPDLRAGWTVAEYKDTFRSGRKVLHWRLEASAEPEADWGECPPY